MKALLGLAPIVTGWLLVRYRSSLAPHCRAIGSKAARGPKTPVEIDSVEFVLAIVGLGWFVIGLILVLFGLVT